MKISEDELLHISRKIFLLHSRLYFQAPNLSPEELNSIADAIVQLRLDAIKTYQVAGFTNVEIAKAFNLSPPRISQLARDFKCT